MKKLSLIVLLLAITNGLFAGDFRIGLNANPTFNWIKPDGAEPLKKAGVKTGFIYGLVTEFQFGENYSLVTGVNVSNSVGGKLSYNDSITIDTTLTWHQVSKERTYKIKYLTIPLALKMTTKEIGVFKYYGQFGIELGVRLNSRANDVSKGETIILDEVPVNDQKIDDIINLFRTGLIIGVGIEKSISGSTAVLLGVQYNNGFSKLFTNKVDKVEYLIDGKKPLAYSKALTITFGIMF